MSTARIAAPLPLTLLTVCMNRWQHLRQTVAATSRSPWHQHHLIIDWSSEQPLRPEELPDDPRIRLVRVDGESAWHHTRAFNFGLGLVTTETVLKLDADVWIDQAAGADLACPEGVFRVMEARAGLYGTVLARLDDLRAVGGYNEFLSGYGKEDKDLYRRLEQRCRLEPLPAGLLGCLDSGDELRAASAGARRLSGTGQRQWSGSLIAASRARNALIAKRCPWSADQPHSRYELLGLDRYRVVGASLPTPPQAVAESARITYRAVLLSKLLGVHERLIVAWLSPRQQEQLIARPRLALTLARSLEAANRLLLLGVKLILRLCGDPPP
ncbi:MAG: glycosyltransferase family 2 protein [Cyanobacteriota bacterium]|jgi:hypothetical protein